MDDFMLVLGLLLVGLGIWLLACVFIMGRETTGGLTLYFTGICFGLTVGIVISLAMTNGTGY